MKRFRALVSEIHQRSIWQVLGIYVAGSWVALEVAGTITESFGLPEWFPAFALALLVLGLPMVLATAFVQEGGAARAPEEPLPSRGLRHRAFTWRNFALGGIGALALLVGAAGWIVVTEHRAVAPAAGRAAAGPSIAVLPFDDMSPAGDQAHFSDGIAEEILNALTRVGGLRVAARTSSFAYKGRSQDIREIGRALSVDHVLEGSVRKEGDTVRITAQLIATADGFHTWSEVYERELRSIFEIQDEITRAIVSALEVRLRGDEAAGPLVAASTGSPEAYNAYLAGRYHWNRRNEPELRTAIRYFERALALDPSLAAAHAGLAGAHASLGYYNYAPPHDAFGRARAAARRALELEPENAEAHAVLGYVLTEYDFDWDGAERAFRRAIELNPGSPDSHRWLALALAARGLLDESVAHARTAVELDPLSPITHRGLGRHHYFRREYDEARRRQLRALEIAPGFFPALYLMAQIDLAESRWDDALGWIRRTEAAAPGHPIPAGLAVHALARSGQRQEAERRYEALRARADEGGVAFWLAVGAIGFGRHDDAIRWLEAARAERSPFIAALTADPILDPLRDDPGFRSLLRDLGL